MSASAFLSLVFHWFLAVLLFSDSSFGFSTQRTSLTKIASSDRFVKMGSLSSFLEKVDYEDEKQSTTSTEEFDSATERVLDSFFSTGMPRTTTLK